MASHEVAASASIRSAAAPATSTLAAGTPAKLPAKRKAKHAKRRSDPRRPEGWQGGPLPGWGVEMPYSMGCQRSDCQGSSFGGIGTRRRSLDIVVAARDQPSGKLLRLLLEALPLARLRTPTVWVYHKGSPKARELAELRAATARLAELKLSLGLPNVGRAEHTCVHHIVRNFETLADLTLFLKDTALAHAHLGVATRLLAFARRLPMEVDAWCARPPVAINLSFALDSYQSETCWRFGRCYGNESWKLATVRPFGAWLASHGITPILSMPRGQVQACYGGFFGASRRALLTTPRATYAAIEQQLMQADSLEEGHYMERTWPTILGLRQPLQPQFVRVGIYTAVCGAGASAAVHNQTWHMPSAAMSMFRTSSRLRVPSEYLECTDCAAFERVWQSGLTGMLRFLFFSDQPQVIAEARRHGWSATLLPSTECRPRELKIHAEGSSELGTLDYTAYVPPATASTSDAISIGAVLHMATNHLGSGPSVVLLVRRRGGLDSARPAERAFLARHATNHSRTARSSSANRTMLVASAVIRRASRAARTFSDRWHRLVSANPHVREQFCLDVLLQEAATGGTMHSAAHPEVALVDARTAKQLTYPP